MKIIEFKKPKDVEARYISELLNQAEVAGGRIMFRDEMGQIWNLEKVEDVELSEG